MSGVSLLSYWTSNLLADMIKYLLPFIVCSLMCLAYDIDALTEDDNYGVVWALFGLYGPAIAGFCYLASFLFKDYANS